MKILFLDCFCGASGDMIVGALLDAGASFDSMRHALATLDVSGYTLSAKKMDKHGMMATKFDVILDEGIKQPHRHLRHIVDIIDSGDLPEAVKEASKETFRRIAECEAEVHGSTVEKVHFHEVGAVDSIVDVVGAHFAFHDLGIEHVESTPLHVGTGTVTAAHGVMPVPAPATALLLRGVPTYASDVEGELVTPTGAALVVQWAQKFGPMPEMKSESIGYGSGTRDLPDRANVLRVFVGETTEAHGHTERIVVIEANIDDMIGELFPPLIADLIEAGAKDAFVTPILGKKGRPAHLLTVLCEEGKELPLSDLVFKGSTTLGVRMRTETRICLDREWKEVDTKWGHVRIKIGTMNGEIRNTAPEFDDCLRVAQAAGVPVITVYETALAAAIRGDLVNE